MAKSQISLTENEATLLKEIVNDALSGSKKGDFIKDLLASISKKLNKRLK